MQNTPVPAPCRLVVKLGGAAITDKTAAVEALKPDGLAAAADAVAAAVAAGPPGSVVVVHGAGSFGHNTASQYNVARGGVPSTSYRASSDGGPSDSASRARHGFALTRASVTRLNGHVLAALLARGVPAVGLSPCGAWTCRGRSLQQAAAGVAAVEAMLHAGLVPVLHGDAVLDTELGCTILSGDTVVRHLAEVLRPQCVVFVTNVPGIYDRPPEEAGAQLIRDIEVAEDGTWSVAGARAGGASDGSGMRLSSAAHDTTGGMAMKVQEAAATAAIGIPVVIAQAGSPAVFAACVHGVQGMLLHASNQQGTDGASGMDCTLVRPASVAQQAFVASSSART